MRSPLKWVGGKGWIIDHFLRVTHGYTYDTIAEPFAGGLGLSFGLEFPRVLANDLNYDLIDFYRWLQYCPSDLEFTGISMETYYKYRKEYNATPRGNASDRRAKLFYFLNKFAFNGLYRCNKSGKFNVPWNKKDRCERLEVFPYRQLIQGWTFTHSSAFKHLATYAVCPEVLVFADPPYDGTFTDYTAEGFNYEKQVALVEALRAHRGPVVATNSATPRMVQLYTDAGFTVEQVAAPRRVAAGRGASTALEMIAYRGPLAAP